MTRIFGLYLMQDLLLMLKSFVLSISTEKCIQNTALLRKITESRQEVG